MGWRRCRADSWQPQQADAGPGEPSSSKPRSKGTGPQTAGREVRRCRRAGQAAAPMTGDGVIQPAECACGPSRLQSARSPARQWAVLAATAGASARPRGIARCVIATPGIETMRGGPCESPATSSAACSSRAPENHGARALGGEPLARAAGGGVARPSALRRPCRRLLAGGQVRRANGPAHRARPARGRRVAGTTQHPWRRQLHPQGAARRSAGSARHRRRHGLHLASLAGPIFRHYALTARCCLHKQAQDW